MRPPSCSKWRAYAVTSAFGSLIESARVAQRADQRAAQVRLGVAQRGCIERVEGHAVFGAPALGGARFRIARRGRAEHLQPPAFAQQCAGAGRYDQRAMLGHAVFNQRRIHARDLRMTRRMGIAPVAVQERNQFRQRADVIADVGRAVARVFQQRAEAARKRIRIHAFALDQPGVAKRRLVAGRLAVDERDRQAALLQVNGNGHADHAAARDERVECHREFSGGRCRRQASAVTAISTSRPVSSATPAHRRGSARGRPAPRRPTPH